MFNALKTATFQIIDAERLTTVFKRQGQRLSRHDQISKSMGLAIWSSIFPFSKGEEAPVSIWQTADTMIITTIRTPLCSTIILWITWLEECSSSFVYLFVRWLGWFSFLMQGNVCILWPLLQLPLDRGLYTDPKLISNNCGETKWDHFLEWFGIWTGICSRKSKLFFFELDLGSKIWFNPSLH